MTNTAIWTDEAIAAALATPGVRLETAAERGKWLDAYAELDVLAAEGERERQRGWFPNA
jgi:hypothetical protein